MKTDELSEVKGQFLASLNHELRTPLSGILGMTDLLLETSLTDDQREYVGATRSCAENLLEVLNVTLEFSALSANHIQLEEAEFSLKETIESVVAEFAFKAASKGLKLSSTLDRNLPNSVIGDPVRLRRILWHLVANAVKFTHQGEVEVRASAGRPEKEAVPVAIQVRDTGIGIPQDQLESIFECFQQLETGLSRNYPGLGLGLAVAEKLAILLGGSITVASEVAKGSTFTTHLRLRLPAAEARPSEEAKAFRARVLVVEDNPVAQTIASHALRRQAYQVECAADGLQALEIAANQAFDLIFMDLQMPGLDGFETTKRIRRMPGYSDTPIIALTANTSDEYRKRCTLCGMQGFLAKPVRTRELVLTVERFLEAVPR